MKNILGPLAVALSLFSFPLRGEEYKELPPLLDGSMSLYDFSKVEPSAVPDSLKVVAVNLVSRHGARYLSSSKKVESVVSRLEEMKRKGSLTPRGERCLSLMEEIDSLSDGRWGMLSRIGIEQELRVGEEIARMYPEIFRQPGSSVSGISSPVPRVIETMDCVTLSVARANFGIPTSSRSGDEFNHLTRFFETDSVDDQWRSRGEWKKKYGRYVEKNIPTAPAQRLVGADSGLTDKELRDLTFDLYKVFQGLRAMGLNGPTTEWMSREEYESCWHASNLEKYFRNAATPLSDIPALAARELLTYLLDEGEKVGRGESRPGLTGIYGHAETLLPLISLMGLDPETPHGDYEHLADYWSDAVLTPLGANLEIVYSRGASGTCYVSLRLNGRNIPPLGRSAALRRDKNPAPSNETGEDLTVSLKVFLEHYRSLLL